MILIFYSVVAVCDSMVLSAITDSTSANSGLYIGYTTDKSRLVLINIESSLIPVYLDSYSSNSLKYSFLSSSEYGSRTIIYSLNNPSFV